MDKKYYTLQETLSWINTEHSQTIITQELIFNCAALKLIPLRFHYSYDLSLRSWDNTYDCVIFVGNYRCNQMVEIQDHESSAEGKNFLKVNKVRPLEFDRLISENYDDPFVTNTHMEEPYFFQPYFKIMDESDPDLCIHYSDGCDIELSELLFDASELPKYLVAIKNFKQQIQERHESQGLYTIKEAAFDIAMSTNENIKILEGMLLSAVEKSLLTAYYPNSQLPIESIKYQNTNLINFAEILWIDLNNWIKANTPRLNFTFSEPIKASTSSGIITKTKPGITNKRVITAFSGMLYTDDRWSCNLASPRKWLNACRAAKGQIGNNKLSATWWPHHIALNLVGKKWLNNKIITVGDLDIVFSRHLKEWSDEWHEVSEHL